MDQDGTQLCPSKCWVAVQPHPPVGLARQPMAQSAFIAAGVQGLLMFSSPSSSTPGDISAPTPQPVRPNHHSCPG